MLNISRILFVGEPANIKVGPHNTDPTKLVLKSLHPEMAAALCKSLNVEAGEMWRGHKYFITPVDKVAFLAAFGALAQAFQALPEPEPMKALTSPSTCSACGGTDGGHWGWCPQHMENKGVN